MQHRIALLAVLLIVASSALAETLLLPVTADTGVTSVRGRENLGNGGGPSTELRQNQNWSGFESKDVLLGFEPAERVAGRGRGGRRGGAASQSANTLESARGMTIAKANLHVVVAKGNLYGVGLCTVLAPWVEGGAVNWGEQPGASSFDYARTPKAGEAPTAESWYAWPGSGVYGVCWMHPSARYSHAGPNDLKRVKNGRFEELVIPVDPAVAAAVVNGFSHGLMMTDDKGQVAEALSLQGGGYPYLDNNAEDIFVFTREIQDPKLRPYLEVEGEFTDKTPPAEPTAMKVAKTSPSEQTIWVSFVAPADDKGAVLGYEAAVSDQAVTAENFAQAKKLPLWAMPKPVAAGAQQMMPIWTLAPGKYTLAVRAVDMAGNAGNIAQLAIEIPAAPEAKLAALPAKAPAAKAQAKETPASALSVDVVPGKIQVDPLTGAVQLDQEAYSPGEKYRQDNRVWRDRQVTLCSAANEVVALQLVLGGAANVKNIRVSAGELAGANGAKIAATNFDFYRLWYVHAGNAVPVPVGPGDFETDRKRNLPPMWHGDACLPLAKPFEETFDFPPVDNKIEGQKFQSVWVDLYVPRGTAAGEYTGKITIAADGLAEPITVPVKLSVAHLQIPDQVTWPIELNRYSSLVGWAGGNNAKDPEGGKAIEQAYYTLGHQHRCTLNVLSYTASGRNDAEYLPEIVDKATAGAKAGDWSKWDDRFGPMLTGSLFSAARGYKGPGQDTPVTHMYLPFYEYWPMPVDAANYKDYMETPDRLTFADYAKKAGDLDKAVSDDFKKGYVSMAKQFFQHFKEKGYTGTAFQFFFNDKYYRRCGFFDAEGMVGSKGVSFWLLDEPVDYDDYAANAFFFRLGRQGYEQANTPEVKVEYRADVSQPEMTRTLWDNVCDLWNDAALGRVYTTADVRRKFLPEERSWQYGGGPGVQGPYIMLARSCLNVWSMGTTGGMPYWNAFGDGNAWKNADNLSLYYSGKNYANGGKDYAGPIAGTRMKLMRDDQQMVELLNLLAGKPGWDRPRVRAAIAEYSDDPKAPRLTFDKLSLDKLQEMRDRLVATIEQSGK